MNCWLAPTPTLPSRGVTAILRSEFELEPPHPGSTETIATANMTTTSRRYEAVESLTSVGIVPQCSFAFCLQPLATAA
jgi:hypothetical protein